MYIAGSFLSQSLTVLHRFHPFFFIFRASPAAKLMEGLHFLGSGFNEFLFQKLNGFHWNSGLGEGRSDS